MFSKNQLHNYPHTRVNIEGLIWPLTPNPIKTWTSNQITITGQVFYLKLESRPVGFLLKIWPQKINIFPVIPLKLASSLESKKI